MEIKKAVITCAGPGQRALPLQTLVDQQGKTNSALAIILGEAVSAGIEEIGLVIQPGDEAAYAAAAGPHASRLRFIEQPQPLGYGHAVLCARPFVGGAPFLLMVGDHLYVTDGDAGCARQLIECARREDCSISAVQATHESKLPYYGAIGGRLVTGRKGLYEIEQVVEKPTPTQAEQQLIVPGLRAGKYLCYFGLHALSPLVMEMLEREFEAGAEAGTIISLSYVLNDLASRERYLAFELAGRRFDIGARYGLLTAQMAIALAGRDRDEVLTTLVDLLANQPRA